MTDSNTPEPETRQDDGDARLGPLGWLLMWGFLAAVLLWPFVRLMFNGNA
jgi:hypothetical protein